MCLDPVCLDHAGDFFLIDLCKFSCWSLPPPRPSPTARRCWLAPGPGPPPKAARATASLGLQSVCTVAPCWIAVAGCSRSLALLPNRRDLLGVVKEGQEQEEEGGWEGGRGI